MSLAGSISIAVGPSTKGFWTKFNADVKKNPPKVEVKVNPDLTRLRNEINAERKRQELNAVNLKVKLDQSSIRGVENQLKRVEHVWKGSAWSKAVKVNLYVAGAASLPSLISGLMSLTTAVTQLGRAALVLPGIFSGLAVSVGAFSTGIVGVAEAIKQSNNSLDNAAQKARTYERATRDLERAQRDVVQALKDANREIEDQKNKLTNNQLSVEQAQLNLRKANKELSKGGFETNDDYRQAVLDQKRAQLELNDVVKQSKRDIQDYYDEAKKGATQSDTFKDSVDRLNTAVEDFTKTQTEAAGASEKFLQAMASLSPNAKDFVLQVLSMKSAWEGLQRGVSDKLFDGVGKAITDLAKTKLPMLRKGMQDVAAGLNNDIKGMISSIGKDANANSLSKIFERTAAALNIMKPGLDSMITGFMKLSEVGSRFLPRLASAFNLVADRFDKFIEKADKNGSLERWINQGLNLVSSLTRSVGYLGSIFGSITRSYEKATGNIGGFATTIEKQLKKWSDTLSSAAGQQKLTEWISKSKDFIETIKRSLPGIQNLFQALGDGARQFAKVAFPIFSALGNFLERNAILAENLFIMYAVMKTWKPIANIFSKIKDPLVAGIRETQAAMAARTAMNAQIRAQEKEREEAARERLARAKELRAIEDRNVVAAQRASAFAQIEARTRASQGKLELKLAGDRLDAKKADLDAAKLQAAQSSEASVAMAKRSVGVAELQSGLTQNQGRIDLEQSARRIRAGEGELAALRKQAEQSAEAVLANKRNLNLISSIGVESDISNEPRGRGSTTRGERGRFVRADDAAPRQDGDFYDAPPRTRGYYSQEEGRFVPLNSPATGFTDRIEELKRFRSQQAALVVDLENQRNAILDAGRTAGGSSPQQLRALQTLSARITDEEANLQALNMAVNGKKGSLEEARRIAYDQTVSAQARQAQDVQNIAKLEEKLDSDRRKYGEHQSEVDRKNLDSKARLKGSLDDLSVVQSGSSAAQIADLERVRRLEGEVDAARTGYARTQLSVGRTNLEANEKLRGSVNDLAIVQDKAKDAAKLQGEANAQVVKSMNTASEATNRLGGQGRAVTATIGRLEGRFPRLADAIDKTTRAIGVGGSGGKGLAGRLGGLLGLLGNTARAIAGVAGFAGTIGLMFALDKLADAHQKAGDRAEYQRSRLEALKNQVDPTTGAVTQAAIAEALDQAADFSVTGDENRKVKANPITAANKLGISTETLGSSLNPINLDAINKVQSTADKDTLAAIKSGKDEQWNRFGEQLQRNGVTPEIYAKAINGDQPSVAKFKAAEDGIFRDRNGGSLIDPFGLKRKAMGAVGDLPNLGQSAENLINAGVSGVALGQYQRSSEGGFRQGGTDVRQARRPAVLKRGNPFTGAQDAKWQSDGSGVSFVMEGVDAAKQAALENLGASVEQTGNYGRVVVQIGGDLLTQYVEPARYAAGGSVWGMGSATSDSIPAMLSNGEFVINAKSASAIGHDKLNAMNDTTFGGGGRFSAGGIAHFAPGGPVPRKPPPINPIVPDIAPPSSMGDETLPSTGIGTKTFTPFGGLAPVLLGAENVLKGAASGVFDFLKGATGFGDHNETRTAEVRLNPSPAPITMGALGTPFTKDTTRGAIPAFAEQVLENVYGGKIPEKGETRRFDYPADTPAVPGVPVPHGATNKPGMHLPVGQPGPGGPKSIPGIPGPLRSPATPPPVAIPQVTNGRIPNFENLPSVASAAASDLNVVIPSASGPTLVNPNGGITFNSLAALVDTLPYVWGGGHPGHHEGSDQPLVNGFDCSALASYFANLATGRPLNDSVFGTSTALPGLVARGFLEGPGGPNDLTIGWNPEHTAITIPGGTNVEAANRDAGILVGPNATGGFQFPPTNASGSQGVMHLPASLINPAVMSDDAPPLMPDISALTPPPGAVTGPKKKGEGGIPGIDAPIPGPYGDLPIEPMDLLKKIGEALLTGILGFFGIDASSIIKIVNDIFGGISEMTDDDAELEGDGGVVPEENPNPQVDPGPDPAIIQQFVQAAAEAKARGDEPLARNLLQRARDYQRSRLAESAQPSTLGGLTLESSQVEVAKAILSEARSRGYSKEEAQAILSTAIGSSQLNPRGIDPLGNWTGIFPLAKLDGQQMPGAVDPNQNIASFFDGMDAQSGQGADIWQSIFYASGAPGAVYTQNDASKPRDPKMLEAALGYMQATGYAAGGMVRGPGSGTSDSIPARLSRGEYVVNAEATKNNLPLLQQLNEGGLVGANPGNEAPPVGGSGVGNVSQWLTDYAKTTTGPYVYGGYGTTEPWINPDGKVSNKVGFDCSGIIGSVYALANGLPPTASHRFTTEDNFLAMGFKRGTKPGALNIGVMNGGGGKNSHMAGTMPDGSNIESSGARGTVFGKGAKGATDPSLPNRYYYEIPILPNAPTLVSIPSLSQMTGYANGGLVGYAPGGSVDAQGNTGFELLQAEALRAAFRGDPLKVTAPKMGFAENARSVWRDTGAAFSNFDKNVNNALPNALEAFAPLVGLGDPLRRHLHPEELGPSGIVGADEARRNAASNLARAVGVAPQVNNLLGINDDPRRRRNRFSNVPDVETGTASFYGDMVKAVTQYDKFAAGDTSGALGSMLGDAGIALLTGGSGYAAKTVAKTAVTSAAKSRPAKAAGSRLSAGAGEIKRSFGIGAGAAGAVPRASGAARRAALADVTLDTGRAGFYGRRQIRNALGDLMVAHPEIDIDRLNIQTDMEIAQRYGPEFASAYGLSTGNANDIVLNSYFFGRGNLGRLRGDIRGLGRRGGVPAGGFRDEIFNVIAHEFGHRADPNAFLPVGRREDLLADAGFQARMRERFRSIDPAALGLPDGGEQAFNDYLNQEFYRGSFDREGIFSRREALATAFSDVSSFGRLARRGSRGLFEDEYLGGRYGSRLSSSGRPSAMARKPFVSKLLSPEGLAAKNRYEGPTGVPGGDFKVKPQNRLTSKAYARNKDKGGGWFSGSGKTDIDRMVQNLLDRFNDTTGEKAWIRDSGLAWYSDAREWLVKILDESGGNYTLDQAAAAVAALSTNSTWNKNMLEFSNLIGGREVHHIGNSIEAAKRALNSDNPLDVLGDDVEKWRNFAASILGKQLDGKSPVAVDRWAARAALGTEDMKLAGDALGREGGFQKIADAYRLAAKEAGISSEQMQAVIWMHGIKPMAPQWNDIAGFLKRGKWSWADEVTMKTPRGINTPYGAGDDIAGPLAMASSMGPEDPFGPGQQGPISAISGGSQGQRFRSAITNSEDARLIRTALRGNGLRGAEYAKRNLTGSTEDNIPLTHYLNEGEREQVFDYTEGSLLSTYMRLLYSDPEAWFAEYGALNLGGRFADQAAVMDSAIGKGRKTPNNLILSRSVSMGAFDSDITGKLGSLAGLPGLLGQKFTDFGYMSTAVGAGRDAVPYGGAIRHEMYVPEGTPGLYVGKTKVPRPEDATNTFDPDPYFHTDSALESADEYGSLSLFPNQNELILPGGMQYTPFDVSFNPNFSGMNTKMPDGSDRDDFYDGNNTSYGAIVRSIVDPTYATNDLEYLDRTRNMRMLEQQALEAGIANGWKINNKAKIDKYYEGDTDFGLGLARGGHVSGPGSGTSDSIPAMLSHGEFVIKADAVKRLGVKRLNAMNSIPRFADGGLNLVPGLSPPIIPPGGPLTDVTDPALADPSLNNPPAPMEAPDTVSAPMENTGLPPAPDAPDPNALANDPLSSVPDLNKTIDPDAAAKAGEILSRPVPVIGGSSSAGIVEPQAINPRAKLQSAPSGASHVNPALAKGISGAIGAIGALAKTASKVVVPELAAVSAIGGAVGGASGIPLPGGGDPVAAGIDLATQVASDISVGAANVISSLLVGTVTPSQTGQGYGAPMLPQREAQPSGSNFQSIHNGDVVTNNLSEYSRMEERKRAQREAPFMNRSGN